MKVRDNHATYEVSSDKPNIIWGVAVRCKDDKKDDAIFICYETKDYDKALDFIEAVQTGHTGYKNVVDVTLVEKSIQIFRAPEPSDDDKPISSEQMDANVKVFTARLNSKPKPSDNSCGKWKCDCGEYNYNFQTKCFRCEKPRPKKKVK